VTSRTWLRATLAGASFLLLAATAYASPQVVGDEACERHEVDIASFASCVDGKAVLPAKEQADGVPSVAGGGNRNGAAASRASPQVVGDEACERHEVDIASFATCVGGKVVLPAADAQDDDATPVARGHERSAALFAADTRLGLPWLLVTQVFAAERTGMRHDTPAGCDGGPAGPTVTVAQLR